MRQLYGMTMLCLCGIPLIAAAEKQYSITVEIAVPAPCYKIEITDVYRKDNDLAIVAHVVPPPKGSSCSDTVSTIFANLSLPIQKIENTTYYILGKDWCWEEPGANKGYLYPNDLSIIHTNIKGYESIYSKKPTNDARNLENLVDCK